MPTRDRSLRLRWLLNALEEQTLPDELWEVVVAHDDPPAEATTQLLDEHSLARAGQVRSVVLGRGASAASKRNAGWRAARGELVLFTDDDCRPPAHWLERALAAARLNPGAIVQGMTLPDPEQQANFTNPWFHSQGIVPPEPYAQTCNILYPRALLEQTGGFVEDPPIGWGDDTELALRARAAGAPYVGDRAVLSYHAVVPARLARKLGGLWCWVDAPWMVKRHPGFREHLFARVFWRRPHALLLLALLGLLGLRHSRLSALLTLPFLADATPRHGVAPRALLRAATELPGWTAIYAVETTALARGSLKYRTLVL